MIQHIGYLAWYFHFVKRGIFHSQENPEYRISFNIDIHSLTRKNSFFADAIWMKIVIPHQHEITISMQGRAWNNNINYIRRREVLSFSFVNRQHDEDRVSAVWGQTKQFWNLSLTLYAFFTKNIAMPCCIKMKSHFKCELTLFF